MPTKKTTTKKRSPRTKRKTKTKARPADRDDKVVVEETTRVERAPVVVRREPATLARALAERLVVETPETEVVETVEGTEPEVERTVIRKRRRKIA